MKFTTLISIALFLGSMLVPALAQAQSGGQVTLEQVQSAVNDIKKLAQTETQNHAAPGLAIAVIYQGKVVYLGGFGVREMGKDEPVTADTVFQLASMSKPIGSTIVAALVSKGVVSWDSRISDLDPSFQLSDPWVTHALTLRDLFSHRSGLYGLAGNELEILGFDRKQILHRLRYLKPVGPFRASYAYSNFGLTEGGVAAAKAAGMSWEEAAEDMLYKPLGMTHTSSSYAGFLAQPNRTHLHILVDGKWAPKLTRDADAQSPAGGVSSSVRDLAQWLRLQLGDGKINDVQLISKAALAATHQPLIIRGTNPFTGRPAFYGLGWDVDYEGGLVYLSHAGAFSAGASTYVKMAPTEHLGIIVLSNAFPTGAPQGIADTFFDLVHYGKPQRDWIAVWDKRYAQLAASLTAAEAQYAQPPANPSPALPTSAYVGSYSNAFVGAAKVTAQGGALTLHLGSAEKKAFPLTHWDRDVFLYYPFEETPDSPVAVTFTIGADQKATQLVIEDLNGDGQGTLTRVSDGP